MRRRSLRQLLAFAIVVLVFGLVLTPAASAQSLPFSCTGFTDDPIQPGITEVKAQHITELRACVDDLRVQSALARVTWTDPTLQPQRTWIRAVHVTEHRTALVAVYAARGKTSPQFTDGTLNAQSTLIRAVHITEIRQAILLVAGACSPEQCGTGPEDQALEFYHLDALGSVRAVTDDTGIVLQRHDYFPFGESDSPPSGDDALRFTGQEGDPETGLLYFDARYYRSRTGRFTTADPLASGLLNPQRWNRYAYALNNPLSYTDSSGLTADSSIPGFCSASFSFGQCGGEWMFWNMGGGGEGGGGGGGFEFGDDYANAQLRGYQPGMPPDVWQAMEEWNQTSTAALDAARDASTSQHAQEHTPVASVSTDTVLTTVVTPDGKTLDAGGVKVQDNQLAILANDVTSRSGAMTQPSSYVLLGLASTTVGMVVAGGPAVGAYLGQQSLMYWIRAEAALPGLTKFSMDFFRGVTRTGAPDGTLGCQAGWAVRNPGQVRDAIAHLFP